jgi:hypothetical protein
MPTHAPRSVRHKPAARAWCLAGALALGFSANALAQTLSSKSKETGCVDKPKAVVGSMYRCTNASGAAAYFNVPEATDERAPRRPSSGPSSAAPAPATAQPSPPGLPRVDAVTQKGRDELRRKVLQDELATEEKLLLESRNAYANGAPPALADEQKDSQRYADRIARLRQAVQLHERNVEALRRELGLPR